MIARVGRFAYCYVLQSVHLKIAEVCYNDRVYEAIRRECA